MVLLTFLAVWLPAGLIMYPAVKAIYNTYILIRIGDRNLPAFIPALVTGIALQMTLFSLLARQLNSFGSSFLIAYFLLGVFSFAVTKTIQGPLRSEKVIWSRQSEWYSILAFLFCWALLLILRAQFSYLYFDPGRGGAEKLFNFGFQSSYIFSQHYPTENIWYANHPNTYYILTKSLGGIPLRLLNVFSTHIYDGTMFHVADTFLYALAVASLGSFTFILTRVFGSRVLPTRIVALFSLFTALTPLFGGPFRLLAQSYEGRIDLWPLSRIIDNTINEYPFWNFLWADYHSHSSAIFLQLGFWFWLLLFFGIQWAEHWSLAVILGALTTAILMSHSGSLLISAVGLGGLFVFLAFEAKRTHALHQLIKKGLMVAAAFLLLAAPEWLGRTKAEVVWYLVPKNLASSLKDYLNIYFYLFVFGMILLIGRSAAFETQATRRTKEILFACVILFLATLAMGWTGAGFAMLLFGMSYAALNPSTLQDSSSETPKWFFIGLLLGISAILAFPELVAANYDMGAQYMRYNTVFRFLFESYYLLPMCWVIVLVGSCRVYSPRALAILSYVGLTIVGLFAYGQFKSFQKRTQQTQPFTLDGLAAFREERPGDWKLIEFLRTQPATPRIVIAEECGIDPKPNAYSLYGRISAISGRPAVCGWSLHVFNHNRALETILGQTKNSYGHLLDIDKATSAYFNKAAMQPETPDFLFEKAQQLFKALGVTHLVFGELERQHHPLVSAEGLSQLGKLVFNDSGAIVVNLQ